MRPIVLSIVWVLGFAPLAAGQTVSVFRDTGVQSGGPANWKAQPGERRRDAGRVVDKQITLPELGENARVTAKLHVMPHNDPHDRAGSVLLIAADGQQVELVKFVTGFGGETRHSQDVSALKPLLAKGPVTIRVFIDTTRAEAWSVDFDLVVSAGGGQPVAWSAAVVAPRNWESSHFKSGRQRFEVTVPEGVGKVELRYFATGHCTDGRGGDEFVTRTHRVFVDGKLVHTAKPWRTDGHRFRKVNPRSARWNHKGKEVWSSDLPRSGWVPGDDVDPMAIDLTAHLTPGKHVIEYHVDGIRPRDGKGAGFWRVSSYVWATPAQ